MTAEEAKQILYSKQPVWYGGVRYDRVIAIIYSLDGRDNLIVSAQLLDANKNSVVQARIKEIKLQEEKS